MASSFFLHGAALRLLPSSLPPLLPSAPELIMEMDPDILFSAESWKNEPVLGCTRAWLNLAGWTAAPASRCVQSGSRGRAPSGCCLGGQGGVLSRGGVEAGQSANLPLGRKVAFYLGGWTLFHLEGRFMEGACVRLCEWPGRRLTVPL